MSTAVSNQVLVKGASVVVTADGRMVYDCGPVDIHGNVWRDGWRWAWCITPGRDGLPLKHGTAWTRGGAWVKAGAAAHKPGLTAGAR